MKLKGLKYYILGLIGLPIFLVNISNAGLQEFDLGQIESITANTSLGYDLRLTANANFLTNDLYKVVQFKGNGNYPTTWTFFWNGSGMYVLNSCNGGYECNGSILGQGYFNYVSIVNYSTINMQYSIEPGFTPVEDFLTNSQYNNPDKLLLGGNGNLQSASLCFVYSDINKAVCFSFDRVEWNNCGGHPEYCTNGVLSYITNSKGYSTQDITQLAQVATVSPFVNIPNNTPNYISTGNINSSQNMYDSFRSLGYSDEMCYGGFALNDLLLTGSSNFRDMQVGGGATILSLYSTYSGGMTFRQWWNSYDFDYGFLQDYNEYEPFLNKSKGLVGMFIARDTFFKRDGFDPGLLLTFCTISLSDSSLDRSKTPLDIINDTVLNSEIQRIIGDFGVLIPTSGSALDLVASTVSGYNDITDIWNKGYNVLSSFRLRPGGTEGILPQYIIVGFLAIVLLYLLRK